MKKLNLLTATLALAVGSLTVAQASIVGSAHDWSNETWNNNKDLCGPCHMAHGSDPANQLISLWSHETVSATWTVFVSPRGTTINQPSGASLACLSCHDGTLAYNQLKGVQVGPTAYNVQGSYVIGNGSQHNLRGDHPISFSYSEAVTKSPTNTLKLATETLGSTTTASLSGQTVGATFLKSGNMECTSCHDVHRSIGDSGTASDKASMTSTTHNPLLIAYGRAQDGFGSSLCRSCHNK
jgi:hypothetical protein